MCGRVREENGQDGSLESRLYLTGAGKGDTGRSAAAQDQNHGSKHNY